MVVSKYRMTILRAPRTALMPGGLAKNLCKYIHIYSGSAYILRMYRQDGCRCVCDANHSSDSPWDDGWVHVHG